MCSMVEGACSAVGPLAPTTALRAVPLPRFAGEDMPRSRHLPSNRFRRVVAEKVDHLDDDRVVARIGVCVPDFEQERVVLARAIGLPLVVERVTLVVPIHRPIVDPLRPVLDGALCLLRHVVGGNGEVLEPQSDISLVRPHINRQRGQFEEPDVVLRRICVAFGPLCLI